MKKVLNRQETDFMRDYINEGVRLSETHLQIQARRRELADLFECTLPQVAGATAWKLRENGELILEPLELASNESARDENQIVLQPKAASTEILANSDVDADVPVVEMERADYIESPANVPENDEPAPEIKYHPKGGAWADYEGSAIKEIWREKEAEFIDKNIDVSPEVRAKMQVLCTPGIKCHLEVRHLLKLGFKPENITAVECQSKAWEGFEANARELGIRPVFGELINVVKEMRAPIDVACIDFINPGSTVNMMTTEYLPLSPKAIVVINVMAKRETPEFQEMMGRLHKTAALPADGIPKGQKIFRKKFDELIGSSKGPIDLRELYAIAQESHEEFEEVLSTDNDLSWDERDTMLWYMQRYAGTARPESSLFPNMIGKLPVDRSHFAVQKSDELLEDRWQKMFAASVFKQMAVTLQQMYIPLLAIKDDKRMHEVHMLADALNCIGNDRRQIVAMEKYRYNSKIGKTASPFYTSMAVTEVPKKEYRAYGPLLYFALKFAEARAKTGEAWPMDSSKDYFEPFDRQSMFVMNGKKKTASITHGQLLSLLHHYVTHFVPKYPLSLHQNQREIPWTRLESLIDENGNQA